MVAEIYIEFRFFVKAANILSSFKLSEVFCILRYNLVSGCVLFRSYKAICVPSTSVNIRHNYSYLQVSIPKSFTFKLSICESYYLFFIIEYDYRARAINAKVDGIESQTNREIEVYFQTHLGSYCKCSLFHGNIFHRI